MCLCWLASHTKLDVCKPGGETGAPGATAAEQEAAAASVGETPGPSGAEGTSQNAQAAQHQAALDAKDKEVRGVVWFGHGGSLHAVHVQMHPAAAALGRATLSGYHTPFQVDLMPNA